MCYNVVDLDYLISRNYSPKKAAYILEFFKEIKIKERYNDEEIVEIIGDNFGENLISFYNKRVFDNYISPRYMNTDFNFEYIKAGSFDEDYGFYKTKDNKLIFEINI